MASADSFVAEGAPFARARVAVGSRWTLLLVTGTLLWLPLIAACTWLYANDRWVPLYELAYTEMHVRDVGTANTRLIGLSGRLAQWPETGCHPGPLSFYLLAPVYRLFGTSFWALRVSTAALNGLALGFALWMVRRRAGTPGVLAAGAVLILIEIGFGLVVLTEPWNPHLPVLWYAAFLLAIWSVFDGDAKLLPLAVFFGTICAQTHIPYVSLCGALAAFAFVFVCVRWRKAARSRRPTGELRMACLAGLGVAAVLWSPPVIEELTSERGNISIVLEYLRNPATDRVGLSAATELIVQRFDLVFLLSEPFETPGLIRVPLAAAPSTRRGLIVFVLWLLAAGVAYRRKDRTLLALHVTLAIAFAVGILTVSRIFGPPWQYLLFFGWVIGALAVCATTLTGVRALYVRAARVRSRLAWVGAVAALVFIAVYSLRMSSKVAHGASSQPRASEQLAVLAPMAAREIRAAGSGDGRFLLTWNDAVYLADQPFGLLNELERRGLDVFLPTLFGAAVGRHRVITPGEATARVHFANAGWIDEVRTLPGAVQIAYADLRTPEQRREYEKLHAEVVESLEKIGRNDLVPLLERKLHDVEVPELDGWNRLKLARMHEIGVPAAVFLLPPR